MSKLDYSEQVDSPHKTTQTIGVVQQTNLRYLEKLLTEKWNLGQNILLCWSVVPSGVQVLVVPHYYLGKFSASLNDSAPVDRLDILNGRFIRELISGSRQLSFEDLVSTARRLNLKPVQISLPVTLSLDKEILKAVDALIKRYSINFVKSRAVLLFDIVNFTLVTPFEQTSQLNSLSYSLNSACHKLLKNNIEISFSRSTTGDGYYVWNNSTGDRADMELFQFMLLVLADNAIAQRKASLNCVPTIRTGFHIGSHYEFYQVEHGSPGMNNYIVGDVTIELARMLDIAQTGQIFIGDFEAKVPTSNRENAYLVSADSQGFVERASKNAQDLLGIELSDERIQAIHCYLTGDTGACGGQTVRRFRITDKHGCVRTAYNLRINIRSEKSAPIILGKQSSELPKRKRYRRRRVGENKSVSGKYPATAIRPRSMASIAAYED
ncbi:MAG: hypothetical protein JKY66_10920 [Spongiibacteraceae bacterium]|nr:hypothetical protein [Spongiibacteraceae bacterium]